MKITASMVLGALTTVLLMVSGWLYTAKGAQEKAQWITIKTLHEQVFELRVQVEVLNRLFLPEREQPTDDAVDVEKVWEEIENESEKRRGKDIDEFIMRQEAR